MAWRWKDEPSRWDYLPDVEATYWFAPIWSYRERRGPVLEDEEDLRHALAMLFEEVGSYMPAHFPGAIPLNAETPETAKVEAAMIWHRWEATPFGRREADGYRIVDNGHLDLEARYFRGERAPGDRDTNPRQLALPGIRHEG